MDASSSSWLAQAIEQVTDPTQSSENWPMIMKICDEVATHQHSAEEAMRVIQKRLRIKSTNQGWRLIALTLTLLGTLVKNCGEVFHMQLANEDFLRALKAIIAPKNNPPLPIEEQVLEMIQYWTFIFGDESGLGIIRELYQDCEQQGFQFPPVHGQHVTKTAVSTENPTKYPASISRTVSQPALKTMARPKTSMASYNRNNSVHENLHKLNENSSSVIRNLSDEQLAKLRSELDLVHINLNVFEEMISNLEPGDEHPDDLELFIDLHKTCKKMQARIVSLLSIVAIDDVAVEFLRCNDRLNRAFNDYKAYMEKRERFWYPLAPHEDLIKNERESLSHPKQSIQKPARDSDDDSDSNETRNQLKRNVSSAKSFQPRSAASTRKLSAADHDDQSMLPTRLGNIRLAPLPDPVPRLSNYEKNTRRALSAASSVKIERSRAKVPVFDDNEETVGPDETSENINESKVRRPNETRVTSSQRPSRVKQLTTDIDSSAEPGYRITGYQYVTSDSKN